MTDLDLAGKRVLIREDLNVPIRDGEVASDARIRAALPTIEHAVAAGAAVMVLSHLGRPQEGEVDPSLSLAPVAERLAALLGRPVPLCADWMDGDPVPPGEVALAENVRFNRGEKADDDGLARRMAAGYDVFVMDAFGTAHRAQASTHAVARHVRVACAGPLLAAELDALGRALEEPRRPLVAIVGGAKVSTKLKLLETLGEKVDRLIVGGGIANTFIAAAGHGVGSSLHEPDLVAVARGLADAGRARGAEIPVPTDVVVGTGISADAAATVRPVDGVGPDEMILDVGPETAGAWARGLLEAGTIVWNGPVGVFEHDQFGAGTERLARAIAKSPAYTIAGGGDTIAAIDKYGIGDRISYVSTGGGAFLEFLEGRPLPAVEMLEARAAEGPA